MARTGYPVSGSREPLPPPAPPGEGSSTREWRERLASVRYLVPAVPWLWLRLVIAVALAVAVSWAFRAAEPYLADRSWFILLALFATIAAAWIGRFLVGLLTLLLCGGLWAYYFSQPRKSFRLESLQEIRLLLFFLGAGVLICLIIESLHIGTRRNEALAREGQLLAESLLVERRRQSALLSNLPGIVWEVNLEPGELLPQVTFFSNNVSRLVGFSVDELLEPDMVWEELFEPEDRVLMLAALAEVARGSAPQVVRHRWRTRLGLDGTDATSAQSTERWFETHCGAGARDSTNLIRCVSLDVTAKESIERVLAETEGRFREAADRAPILLWIARPSEGIVWTNRAWLDFRGRTLADEAGIGWVEGVHPEDAGRLSGEALENFERLEEFRLEFRIRRADGTWRWILTLAVPRLDPNGEFRDYLGFCVDISDRKQLEMEREALLSETERARNAAEAAIRSKDEFLAKISHELRNPLNGILGWTQILKRDGVSEEDVDRGVELIDVGARRSLSSSTISTFRGSPPERCA